MSESQFRHPLIRVAIYYALLAAAVVLVVRVAPGVAGALVSGGGIPGDLSALTGQASAQPSATGPLADDPWLATFMAMIAASALMLPVVWVYIHTRQKKGYQQSLVQTIMMLPLVVAGVVILVKNSVALAFSLGGIVGAVAFRNRLEDTKDAVYVFLSIAIGLACGVQAFHIAIALSFFFNLVVLALWYTDFGRVPGELAAPVAARRIEAARGIVGEENKRSGEFVSVLDQQILQSMTPDQLEALAERAKSRRKKIEHDLYGGPKFDGVLIVRGVVGAPEDQLKSAVSTVLDREAKEWQFERAETIGNRLELRYQVRTRKSVPRPLLMEGVRRAVIPHADEVSFE